MPKSLAFININILPYIFCMLPRTYVRNSEWMTKFIIKATYSDKPFFCPRLFSYIGK